MYIYIYLMLHLVRSCFRKDSLKDLLGLSFDVGMVKFAFFGMAFGAGSGGG